MPYSVELMNLLRPEMTWETRFRYFCQTLLKDGEFLLKNGDHVGMVVLCVEKFCVTNCQFALELKGQFQKQSEEPTG